MADILSKLRGGDRRSVGNVKVVIAAVAKKPDLFSELVNGLFDSDPVVRMRANEPRSLRPFKARLVGLAQQTRQQELRWHLAQMIPRLELTPQESKTVISIFFDYLTDDSKIVVTFAMQALSDLAIKNTAVLPSVLKAIEELIQTGSPAIQARGNKLLPKLKKLGQDRYGASPTEK